MAKKGEVDRKCFVIDANGKILGKIAAKAATILRGKHKAIYTPHTDTGDMVIIINAEKFRVSGKKMKDKFYQRYSGYPSGLRVVALEDLLKKAPTKALELAIKRMMPAGALRNSMRRKLKIYAGETHPHSTQKPVAIEV